MKLIIVLITLGLSISNFKNKFLEKRSIIGRKLSTINRKNFTLVGFSDYYNDTLHLPIPIQDITTYGVLYFSIHFITNNSFPYYEKTNVSSLIQLANNTNLTREANCGAKTDNLTNELKNWTYNCEIDFPITVPVIKAIKPKINFTFYNDTNLTYVITEQDIEKSSIADKTINSLTEKNESIKYDVFYLNKTIFENNTFILKGNLSYNETEETYINLTLSGNKYNSSITNNEIRFKPRGNIADNLHGKMAESKEGKYVLIYAPNGVNDYLSYPIPKQYISLLDSGNYQKPTQNKNATNQLYFSGTPYALNNLKPYIKFIVYIYYTSLRNLEESYTNITAYGNLTGIDQVKNIAIYNVTYLGTAGKNITNMTNPTNLQFSEDGNNYENSSEAINIPFDLNLLQEGDINIERMNFINLAEKNSTSFTFKFNLTDNSFISYGTPNDAYLKYYPNNNNNTKRDEIKCAIQRNESFCTTVCFPKKNVYTNISTIKIIVNEKSTNSRLRSLESGKNRTILPPTDANGIIDFTYSRPTIFRRSKDGLSAGAIVAIVLVTVAAVVALGLAILFLNRMKASPPPVRNPSDVNIANSTSNINN